MTEAQGLPDFDRVARLYRWAEYLSLGPLLQRTRLTHLPELRKSRHALLFGDGDGRFLARLLQQNPELEATAVDTSATMLHLLALRCRVPAERITTLQTSALESPIPPATDLVVTHFFLDCLPQDDVNVLARRVAGAVRPGTLWLVSDFAIPAHPLLRGPARVYIRGLYVAFRLLTGLRVRTLPDPGAALATAGFRCLAHRERLLGLLYSSLWIYDPGNGPVQADGTTQPSRTVIHCGMAPHDLDSNHPPANDPLPDPEPIAPSLDEPDPGVFHHEPGTTQPSA